MKARQAGWILLGMPAALSAQVPPPAAVPDGRFIREYDNDWLVTVHYKHGRIDERGIASDHVRFRTIDGKRYLTRIEGTTAILGKPDAMPSGNLSGTFNVFDPISMAPKRGEILSSDGDRIVTTFDPGLVTTRHRDAAGGGEQVTTAKIDQPFFDMHGGMTGLLLAALPLRFGYRAQIAGFKDRAIDMTPIAVTGRETIAGRGVGKFTCWRVAVGSGGARSIYWISKRAPYVIRVVVQASNAVATWIMI